LPVFRQLRDEQGVVLLIVLIVVALLTIIVTEFTYTVQLDRHRAHNALDALQASLLARSAINIEESFLLMDKDLDGRYEAYTEEWWLALLQFCDPKNLGLEATVRIACTLEDESGKLNINLTRAARIPETRRAAQPDDERPSKDAFARDALRRIFEAEGIEVDIVDQVKEYWLQEPPIDQEGRTRPITDFRSLEDFAARFRIPTRHLPKLRRILTAVPTGYLRAVNANTAPGMVLAAVINEPNAVAAILDRQRSDDPFKNRSEVSSLLQEQGVEDASIVAGLFDVRSNLFRLRASSLTNADPEGEIPGGIGQTLSVLESRRSGPCRPGEERPCWTLKPLDWQKEGGAPLLEQPPNAFGEADSEDTLDQFEGTAYSR